MLDSAYRADTLSATLTEREMLSGDCPGPSAVVSRDHKAEMFLHGREITVIVQQRVAMLDAEGADDDVGRLRDRDAQAPQRTIIPSGARSEIGVQKRHERIPAQSAFDARGMGPIPGALENLEQNEIADQERLSTGGSFQFRGCGGSMAAQMRDPDGAIDENHDRRGWRP